MSSRRSLVLRLSFGSILMGSFFALPRAAERLTPAPPPAQLEQLLEGVWIYIGQPGNVTPAPRSGGRLKFRMNNRWTFTHADAATGVVKAHFGGTYRVRGEQYIETIDYSADPDDPELRSTLTFTVKVEGDTMTQTGVGNPYTEVWRRVR